MSITHVAGLMDGMGLQGFTTTGASSMVLEKPEAECQLIITKTTSPFFKKSQVLPAFMAKFTKNLSPQANLPYTDRKDTMGQMGLHCCMQYYVS